MALDEQEEVREHLEETQEASGQWLDDRRQQVSAPAEIARRRRAARY